MSEVINFRKARKQVIREQESKKADENRVRFGRTKEERQQQDAEKEKATRILDQHRLSREDNQ
jgi:hypothetical protein